MKIHQATKQSNAFNAARVAANTLNNTGMDGTETPAVITQGTPNLVEITATVTRTPVSKVFARFTATQY